jgi:hypothetical protein
MMDNCLYYVPARRTDGDDSRRSANTPAAAAYLSSPAAERTVPTVLP